MLIMIEPDELKAMFEDAAKVAVAAYIREQTPAKDRISQRKAYEMFGAYRVKNWVSKGEILPLRDGDTRNSTRYYSVTELRTLEAKEKALFAINRRHKTA